MMVLACVLGFIHWSEPFATIGGKGPVCLSDGRLIMVRAARARLVAQESKDEGRTWKDLGTVVTDPNENADMGDGTWSPFPVASCSVCTAITTTRFQILQSRWR